MTLIQRLEAALDEIAIVFNQIGDGTKSVGNALKLGSKTLTTIETEYSAAADSAEASAVAVLRDDIATSLNTLKKLKTYIDEQNTGQALYQGVYDASIGTYPANPIHGHFYKISVPGTLPLGSVAVGDMIIYNSNTVGWDYIPSANDVISVNTQTGEVTLDTDDINEGLSNQYFTTARADARITALVGDTNADLATYFTNKLSS